MAYIDIDFSGDFHTDWQRIHPAAKLWAWVDDGQYGGWTEDDEPALRAKVREILIEEDAASNWDMTLEEIIPLIRIERRPD
jgi:hypothetical protein